MLSEDILLNLPSVFFPPGSADILPIHHQTTPAARVGVPIPWGSHKEMIPAPPLGTTTCSLEPQMTTSCWHQRFKSHIKETRLRCLTMKIMQARIGLSDKGMINYGQKGLFMVSTRPIRVPVIPRLGMVLLEQNVNFSEGGLCGVCWPHCCYWLFCPPHMQVSFYTAKDSQYLWSGGRGNVTADNYKDYFLVMLLCFCIVRSNYERMYFLTVYLYYCVPCISILIVHVTLLVFVILQSVLHLKCSLYCTNRIT